MKKILIANRGEIAVRVIRACRELGLSPVAVYSECDRAALHVRYADEAYADRAERAARKLSADRSHRSTPPRNPAPTRVHPGYGFLAENEDFAAAVRDAGLTFIGPTPDAIETMGSKTAARPAAMRAGVPVVPGTEDPLGADVADAEIAALAASRSAIPLLVKAVAGGGGKGMRTVDRPGRSRRRGPRGAVRSGRRVRRRGRLSRAPTDPAAAHRGAAARRRARHRAAVRRARVLDSAAPPESRRGDAVARRLAGAARGDDLGGGRGREARRLHQRRHDRVPARRGRPVLFPRDEHPAAGRAPDHRDGDRPRSGRAGRFASRAASGSISIRRGCWRRTDTRSSAASTPRIPTTIFCRRPAGSQQLRVPAGPGIRDDSGATAGLDVPIFYDPMISKLVAWAEDRPLGDRAHAARARRVPRHRHQDDGAVLHLAARAAGISAPAVPHDLPRRGAEGTQRPPVRRSRRRPPKRSPRSPRRSRRRCCRRRPHWRCRADAGGAAAEGRESLEVLCARRARVEGTHSDR